MSEAGKKGPRQAAVLTPPRLASSAARDPEVALMLRVQQDEPGAFADLVELYWSRIFGRFYRQLGDRQEAEDMAQDVFMRLYRSRKRYRPEAKFATWLFHISQNVTRNALRSRRRRPCVPLTQLGGVDEEGLSECLLPQRDEMPSYPAEQAEVVHVVRAAVASLAGRQRAALELHQFQHRTYTEVAAEMDMTPKAAKSLLHRARIQLRVALLPFMEA